MIQPRSPYVGRFAPSPTGPLHVGSLVAALASYLDARAHGGQWFVRIDDIDPPRAVPGAEEAILDTLNRHGLHGDLPVLRQSTRQAAYDAALSKLEAQGLLFCCHCTRATLRPDGSCVADCDREQAPSAEGGSLRIRVSPDYCSRFDDRMQGQQSVQLGEQIPNFILRRRDGLIAYQLACAVDDAAVTQVIRGADLLASTHRQRYLLHCLDLAPPNYGHVAVVTDASGNKLSKQTGAPALADSDVPGNLRRALNHLGLRIDDSGEPQRMLAEAVIAWREAHRTG